MAGGKRLSFAAPLLFRYKAIKRVMILTHTHTERHTRTHAHTHTRTHAHTHTLSHTNTYIKIAKGPTVKGGMGQVERNAGCKTHVEEVKTKNLTWTQATACHNSSPNAFLWSEVQCLPWTCTHKPNRFRYRPVVRRVCNLLNYACVRACVRAYVRECDL